MTVQPLTAGDLWRVLDTLPDDTPVRALIAASSANYAELHALAAAKADQLTVTWRSNLICEGRAYLCLDLRPQEGVEHHTLAETATMQERVSETRT